MLLQRLLEYSQRMDECPTTLYSEGPIHYYINLDQDGKSPPQLVNVADRSSPRTPWGQRRPTPQIQRSSGIRPLLMANKADYTLGYAANEGKIKRARKCHQAYLALVERCATWTKEPDVLTVLNFLKENPLTKIKLEPDFEPGGIISFVVNDRVIIDNPAVQAFWASTNEPEDNESQKMQCLVCGNVRPVLDRLQTKVKGIPGGQSSGTNIISANEDPYQSYGLHASLIAPTCYKCGEGFTKGLNRLLSSERNRLTSGNTALIFWTKEEVEFDFLSALDDPDPLQVHTMLQTVQTGQRADVDEEPFYALTLSASGSRAVIRDWVETTIGNAKLQLSTWFQRQHITSQSGAMPQYYGIRALARATVREVHDLPTSTPVTLLRAAITGAPLPQGILYQAVQRNRVEQRVTRPRVALIKLALLSQKNDNQEDYMVQIDTDNQDPGYVCGRLLATLEEAQRGAVKGISTTITQRYYGTAATAPQSVFPRLLKGARSHLDKLARERRGAFYAIERRIEEILTNLDTEHNFPKTLNMEQQGLFALGYYHQRAQSRAQAREAIAKRQAQQEDKNKEDKTEEPG